MSGDDALAVWHPAEFWSAGADGRLECRLCPFRCGFERDGPGRCRVRRRRGDRLETATLSMPLRHRQPIERKPLYHFRPGRRTLTLAAPGCTFRCDYCLNSRFAHAEPGAGPAAAEPFDPAATAAEAARDGLILALSYAEPTLAAEATLELRREAPPEVEIIWKTNGFITSEAAAALAPALAAVNVDLKSADPARHPELTGAPLAPVLEALRRFVDAGVWVEVSTPLVPGVNDDAAVSALAGAILGLGAGVPWHLVRVHPAHRRADADPTPPETLARARRIALEAGIRHVYVERALGPAGSATRCFRCDHPLIERPAGGAARIGLEGGRCPACAAVIAGRW